MTLIAQLHGGPYDGHHDPVSETPALLTVIVCRSCVRVHVIEADVGADPLYELVESDDTTATYCHIDVDDGLARLLDPERAPAILATGRVKAAYRALARELTTPDG